MIIHNAPQIVTPNGYEYQNDEVPADRNFLSDLHGPDGMVSYADLLRLLADRAATVAEPSADDNWLDAALDSVLAELNWTEKRTVGYEAAIRILTGPDAANDEDYIEITGTGPTRRAAVLDAVAKAKGAG